MLNNQKINSIAVLGAGEAGITFMKKIREKNTGIKLTLIDKNAYYFDKAKFINSLDLKGYIDLKDFSKENNITFIQDVVERINLKQKKIYFKQAEPIDFEALVVASGAKSKSIPFKGERREGLFYLSDINPFELKGLLKLSSELIVYVTTFLGIKLCVSLKSAGKDVRVLGDNWDFLGSLKEKVVSFLNDKQINVHLNVTVEEVIGEGQVKATKISPLKVFSSQMVFLDTGFSSNLDFFEVPINITNMLTEFEGVFVAGDCTKRDIENDYFYAYNSEEARIQAELLSEFMLEAKEASFMPKTLSEEDKQKLITDFISARENINLENPSLDKTVS
ncbi:MAG: FAD-dependent oxidoreductase [Candidatus Omnitrophota bacterium]